MESILKDILEKLKKLDNIEENMSDNFERIDQRFDGIDQRLGGMNTRLNAMDQRLDGMNTRLDAMDQRLDAMDQRFDKLDETIKHLGSEMRSNFKHLELRLDRHDHMFEIFSTELKRERSRYRAFKRKGS